MRFWSESYICECQIRTQRLLCERFLVSHQARSIPIKRTAGDAVSVEPSRKFAPVLKVA
jgi:hypothetical protein